MSNEAPKGNTRIPKQGGDGLYCKVRKGILPKYMFAKAEVPGSKGGGERMERELVKTKGYPKGKRRRSFRLVDTLKTLRNWDEK